MKKHYRHENDCLNCGAELQGKYCHVCGQENLQVKESFGHMMNHAISDYFHFDHQFFNTLKPLLFSPGKLTNEYMAGKRVSYLHPVKMYIFISLVYFLLLFNHGEKMVKFTDTSKHVNKEQIKKADSAIRNNTALSTKQKNDIIEGIDKDTTAKDHKKKNFHIFGDDKDTDNKDTTYVQYLASQEKLSPDKKDGFFKRLVKKREFELNTSATNVKDQIEEGMKHNTPKMMFLLLPLFALLLKITFWRNKKFYVEHLIYSFHLHCFLFLFLALIMLSLMAIPTEWHTVRDVVYWFATLSILWYIFQSLRVVYHRSAKRTITKMIGLTLSYTLIFSVCMLFLVVLVALFD
jgi:hypothetical protein